MKKYLIYVGGIGGVTIGVVEAENEGDARKKALSLFFGNNIPEINIDVVSFDNLVNGFNIDINV